MIRRTLVIGLGGTGSSVCTAVAERLVWEFGSLSRLPFIDFLCVDTAEDQIGGVLRDSRFFHHLTVDEETVERMRTQIDTFGPSMQLSRWIDRALLQTMGVVRTGTQGFRMLGRLSLLLPENFERLQTALRNKLNRLVLLESGEASEAFGAPVTLHRTTRVFVVGTTAGGTGSGTYVDMGYLLRGWQKHYGNVETAGILTLPSTDEKDTQKTANTYALLTELNHFSTDGNVYAVKYPDSLHPEVVEMHDYPYDLSYLVTVDVAKASVGGLRGFAELKRTLGQYIHAEAMTRMGEVADGRRNDISRFFAVPDIKGNSQRYMTLGISFLEYPVERVVKGCCARLLTQSLADWLKPPAEAPNVSRVAEGAGLDNRAITARFVDDLRAAGEGLINETLASYQTVRDFDELMKVLVAGFRAAEGESGPPQFPAGGVRRRIDERKKAVGDTLIEKLRAALPLDQGPLALAALLRGLSAHITRLKVVAPAPTDEAVRESLAFLREVEGDFVVRLSFLLRAQSRAWFARQTADDMKALLAQQLDVAASEARLEVLGRVGLEVERWANRADALARYVGTLHATFDRLWDEQDQSIAINGVLLFRAGSRSNDPNVSEKATLHVDFLRLLKASPAAEGQADAERAAQALARTRVTERLLADDALFADPNRSYLDAIGDGVRDADVAGALQDVAGFFRHGRHRGDIPSAFLAAYPGPEDRTTVLERLKTLADPFLGINANDADPQNVVRKSNAWVMFSGAKAESGAQAEFKELLRGRLGMEWTFEELDQTHLAVFLRERGAFALRLVRGIDTWRAHYEAELSRGGGNILHARRDVDWLPIDERDRDRLERAKELFLVGVGLDLVKRGDDTVTWRYDAGSQDRDIRPLVLPDSIDAAARRLRENGKTMDMLDAQIHRFTRSQGEEDAVIRALYETLLSRIPVLGLKGLGLEPRRTAETILNGFIAKEPGLYEAYRRVYPPEPALRGRLLREEGDALGSGARAPMRGYYCDACNRFFGDTPDRVPSRCPCGRAFD